MRDKRADEPDSFERGEALEKHLDDGNARVEVPPRCRGAYRNGEEYTACIGEANLEHRFMHQAD